MIGRAKTQLTLLDSVLNKRKKKSRTDEFLKKMDEFVDWNKLVEVCSVVFKPSKRGRPSMPIIFSLKSLFLQFLYNLSDPGLEDALTDRLSFQRFVGLGFEEEAPDFTTIWRFRERLVKMKLFDRLFEIIGDDLESRGVVLRRGTLVDATMVQSARRPKRKSAEKTTLREQAQQDRDAAFAKKGGKTHYGYKGHIGVDEGSGVIRKKAFTPADMHDSQKTEAMISGDERSVFADKAYISAERKRRLRQRGVFCGILDKAYRNRPLTNKQKKMNKKKSRVRNAVERPFAHFKHLYGYGRARYVNLGRNDLEFTFLCMIHNIRRGIALTAA